MTGVPVLPCAGVIGVGVVGAGEVEAGSAPDELSEDTPGVLGSVAVDGTDALTTCTDALTTGTDALTNGSGATVPPGDAAPGWAQPATTQTTATAGIKLQARRISALCFEGPRRHI